MLRAKRFSPIFNGFVVYLPVCNEKFTIWYVSCHTALGFFELAFESRNAPLMKSLRFWIVSMSEICFCCWVIFWRSPQNKNLYFVHIFERTPFRRGSILARQDLYSHFRLRILESRDVNMLQPVNFLWHDLSWGERRYREWMLRAVPPSNPFPKINADYEISEKTQIECTQNTSSTFTDRSRRQ